ncbi:hypothetical protein HNQ50_003032 [Silvimonas terrae]|uniref:TniQ domain-containing protein n=1 Tax=Silvimonas terrae TaxID=300266 RepID=A0A840RJF2_9NEIS|nr:hypothetical protein [Silvimonas terrae]
MTPRDVEQLGVTFDPAVLRRFQLLPDQGLDPDLHAHVRRAAFLCRDKGALWNYQFARFCPHCLAEDAVWRAEWEVVFFDTCPRHGNWLIDQCSTCAQPFTWHRDSLLRCTCGSDLREEQTVSSPWNATLLSGAIRDRLYGRPCESSRFCFPLTDLEPQQLQRLIRYMGCHLDPSAGPKPLKIRNAGLLEVSWPITSLASEILFNWPKGFYDALNQLQGAVPDGKASLKSLFRHAYSYLYKGGMSDAAFTPVRDAFEIWLTENWKGGIARRNRRLASELLTNVQWIPGKAAADRLGISVTRLRFLIREGKLDAQESMSQAGRRFLMVRKDQLEVVEAELSGEITMVKAIEILGIGKVRMQRILRLLFPSARRVADQLYMPWSIPSGEVYALAEVGSELPVVSIPEEHQVALAHVLRYWNWNADEVVALTEGVRDGMLTLQAQWEGATGIARWVFDRNELRVWYQRLDCGRANWISIPELARILGVKQQVAYWLTQNSYIASQKLGTGRNIGSRVKKIDVERFLQKHIFATEIADRIGRSPRKVMIMLAEVSIYPLRGHSTEACRQLVYVRDEALDRFLARHTVDPSSVDARLKGTMARRQKAWQRIIYENGKDTPDPSHFHLEPP